MPDSSCKFDPAAPHVELPIKTSFLWRPNTFLSSDLHIWSSASVHDFSLGTILSGNGVSENAPKVVIYLIPGNPGLLDFYDRFLGRLFQSLSSKNISSEIIGAGHVGLTLENSNLDLRYLQNFRKSSDHEGYANLQDQIDYHQDLVGCLAARIDPEKTKLILIGHSLGGYIANKVMEKYPDAVFHLLSLYPTISHITRSINGRGIAPFLAPISLPLIHIVQVIAWLIIPKAFAICIIQLYIGITQTTTDQKFLSAHRVKKSTELGYDFNTLGATWFLLRSEMEEVLDLDHKFIQAHKDKMTLYWAKRGADWWIPQSEIDQLIQLLDSPDNQERSGTRARAEDKLSKSQSEATGLVEGHGTRKRWERSVDNIPHAFCFEHGERMAEKCASWIEVLLQ